MVEREYEIPEGMSEEEAKRLFDIFVTQRKEQKKKDIAQCKIKRSVILIGEDEIEASPSYLGEYRTAKEVGVSQLDNGDFVFNIDAFKSLEELEELTKLGVSYEELFEEEGYIKDPFALLMEPKYLERQINSCLEVDW